MFFTMQNSDVTVLLPVYNGERFLRKAIESILNQTFSDFELLIIDDGSSDSTLNIIQSYSDPRIRLFQNNKNLGLIATLNKGLSLAKGKYIARMDADDISHPSRLAKQFAYLSRHPEVGVLGAAVQIIDDNENTSDKLRFPTGHEVIRWHLCFSDPIVHPSVMIRRGFVNKVGGYNSDVLHTEDYDLWRRLSNVTRLNNLNDVLLFLRRHKNSISSMYSTIQRKNSIRISHLMITSILTEKVPIDVLSRLWNKDFNTLNDIREAATLIHRLWKRFFVNGTLQPAEKRLIRRDAAWRFFNLASNKIQGRRAWDVLGLSFRFDPFFLGRAAFRRIRRIVHEGFLY